MLILSTALLASHLAIADSGIVRLSTIDGPYRITVFSEPTPLRAGLIDLSVMVQNGDDETPILDATVSMLLEHEETSVSSILVEATREAATNQLLYSAKLELPEAGQWSVETSVMIKGQVSRATFDFDAAAPLPPILDMWAWFLLPAMALLLMAMNQWLQRRQPKA